MGEPDGVNDLPIVTIASDRIELPIGGGTDESPAAPPIPEWQRWNDYGIGLLRRGQLRDARRAFERVESMGRFDGPLNLARVELREGRVADAAPAALERAREAGAPAWSLLWFGALVARANGDFDTAIDNLRDIARGRFPADVSGTFDFSRDYRVLVQLGDALYQRGLLAEGPQRREAMHAAGDAYRAALGYDPENLAAHWGLKQVSLDLDDADAHARFAAEHARYKPDDNARDQAAARARAMYPAADHAAERVVIYDLQRTDAHDLSSAREGTP
jgi:tetratricopeptide (TPR) repeat protein